MTGFSVLRDQSVSGISLCEGSVSDWDLLLLGISQCQGPLKSKISRCLGSLVWRDQLVYGILLCPRRVHHQHACFLISYCLYTVFVCDSRPFLHLPIIVFRSEDTFLLFSRKAVVAQPPTLTPVTNNICPAAMDPKNTGPVNGDECYFWRTTGCSFGDKCRNKHLPASKGVDKKPWQKT